MNSTNVTELVAKYEEAAIAHGEANEAGRFKDGNPHADVLVSVYRTLKRLGPAAQRELLSLLTQEGRR